MSVNIRQIEPTRNPSGRLLGNSSGNSSGNLCSEIRLEALENCIPLSAIEDALSKTNTVTRRERKLNLSVTMLLVIAMNLFTGDGIGAVLERLCKGLRWLQCLGYKTGDEEPGRPKLTKIPGGSALVYRRYQLGVRPLVALFRAICRPLASDTTQGAFLFGLRLMGIDGQIMAVPDTEENTAYFGKARGGGGQSAFPKVQGVYLCELGTHAIVDAGFWPCKVSEETVSYRLLRSIEAGMLVMFDRGLWAAERVIRIRARGAHVLCRLPSTVKPIVERSLPDGSHLVWISPNSSRKPAHKVDKGTKDQERLLVRLIEYTIDDPSLPGYGEKYRIITSLIYSEGGEGLYSAREIAAAYHERWEIEIAFDEIESHQCVCTQNHHHLHGGPLRSQKPVGVLQELYGLIIAHWAVRSIMCQAAEQAGIDPDRLSFVRSLRIICDSLLDFQMLDKAMWPRLRQIALAAIAEKPLPPRRLRSNPRVVKRQQSKFPVKREKHSHRPTLQKTFAQAIVLI